MIFPDGFIPLREVYNYCAKMGRETFPKFWDDIQDEDDFDHPNPCATNYREALFDRFLDEYQDDLWVFRHPDILLRTTLSLLARPPSDLGPCPTEPHVARLMLNHEKTVKAAAITDDLVIDIKGLYSLPKSPERESVLARLRPFDGSIICYKVKSWPVNLEKLLSPYHDHTYWRSETDATSGLHAAYQAFLKVCPEGKEASGKKWAEISHQTGWSRRQIERALNEFEAINSIR